MQKHNYRMRSGAFGYGNVGIQFIAQFDTLVQRADRWKIGVESHLDAEFLEVVAELRNVVARLSREIVPALNECLFLFSQHDRNLVEVWRPFVHK